MISVILMKPALAGNIGSICRVMKNFDVKELILVNPKCDHLSSDAIKMAVKADDVLRNAKVSDLKILKKFDTLIGTTAKVGADYNVNRVPLTPKQLKEILPKKSKIGLVIGTEDKGLTNEEISLCDLTVTIPASKKYATLNIAQATGMILYELFEEGHTKDKFPLADSKDKEQLMKLLKSAMKKMKFSTKEKEQTQIKVWKRMVGKSFLTKREAMALMGFLKKIIS